MSNVTDKIEGIIEYNKSERKEVKDGIIDCIKCLASIPPYLDWDKDRSFHMITQTGIDYGVLPVNEEVKSVLKNSKPTDMIMYRHFSRSDKNEFITFNLNDSLEELEEKQKQVIDFINIGGYKYIEPKLQVKERVKYNIEGHLIDGTIKNLLNNATDISFKAGEIYLKSMNEALSEEDQMVYDICKGVSERLQDLSMGFGMTREEIELRD